MNLDNNIKKDGKLIMNKIDKFVDEYSLKITFHQVQIKIPSSIKMVASTTYNPNDSAEE